MSYLLWSMLTDYGVRGAGGRGPRRLLKAWDFNQRKPGDRSGERDWL